MVFYPQMLITFLKKAYLGIDINGIYNIYYFLKRKRKNDVYKWKI